MARNVSHHQKNRAASFHFLNANELTSAGCGSSSKNSFVLKVHLRAKCWEYKRMSASWWGTYGCLTCIQKRIRNEGIAHPNSGFHLSNMMGKGHLTICVQVLSKSSFRSLPCINGRKRMARIRWQQWWRLRNYNIWLPLLSIWLIGALGSVNSHWKAVDGWMLKAEFCRKKFH